MSPCTFLARSLVGVAALAAGSSTNAALTINSGDVVDNKYTYRLMYDTFVDQFTADVQDRYFMDPYVSTTSGAKYVRKATSSFFGQAAFTYKFDFSNLDLQIASINTAEILNTYTTDGLGAVNILYSTDGVNFTRKYGLAANLGPDAYNYADPGWRPDDGTVHPDLSSYVYGDAELNDAQVFYYRVEYDVIEGSESAASTSKMAWGRRSQSSATLPMFEIVFDLEPAAVPEPTSLALVGVVGGLLLGRRRS